MVEDIIKPGFGLPRHHHWTMVEIFHILDGEGTFIFDDETVVVTPGMTLTVHRTLAMRRPAGTGLD